MAQPQFSGVVERPSDKALRNNAHDYEKQTETVTSDFETPVAFDSIGQNEKRIVESVSIQPYEVDANVQVSMSISDSDGNPIRWMYGRYPEGLPMQFNPGVPVGPDGSQGVDVTLYHSYGSDVDIRVVVGHREADR